MDDNVIQFPKHKMKKAEPKPKISYELERRMVMTSASMASILVLVSIFNFKILSNQSSEQTHVNERSIASVTDDQQTRDWEKRLLKRLQGLNLISGEDLGRTPSSIDKLRHESLNSNYIIRVDSKGDTVSTISFFKGADKSAKATNIKDRIQFLVKNKEALPSFDRVISVPPKVGVTETFQLVQTGRSIGTVDFRLDKYGNLLKMKVNKFTAH